MGSYFLLFLEKNRIFKMKGLMEVCMAEIISGADTSLVGITTPPPRRETVTVPQEAPEPSGEEIQPAPLPPYQGTRIDEEM